MNGSEDEWGNGLVRCNNEYPLTDGRVNVRLTTNASQAITSSSQPDSFGVNSVTSGTASAYGYGGAAGYREEGISPAGLSTAYAFQKVGARYYDQAFGAFLTRDTDLSQKPYAYCDGDPVNRIDPTGHDSDGLAAAGAAATIGTALIALDLALFLGGAIAPLGITLGIIVLGITMIGLAAYAANKVGQSIADGMKGAAEDAGLDAPPPPRKGIGWQGDKNSPSQMYIPVKGSPGHYTQSGPATSSPAPGSQVLPPGTPYKSW